MGNRQVDIDLSKAINSRNIKKVRELLAKDKGANPFAILTYKTADEHDPSKTVVKTVNILAETFKFGGSDEILAVLAHAQKVRRPGYEPIDLSATIIIDEKNHEYQLNLFQYAALNIGERDMRDLYAFAEATGQNKKIKQILNTDIQSTDKRKRTRETTSESLATMLIRTMSPNLICSSFISTDSSADAEDFAFETAFNWMTCADKKHLPKVTDPLRIIWEGPSNLDFLLSLGLDLDANFDGMKVIDLAEKLTKRSKNKEDFGGFKRLLRTRNVTITSNLQQKVDPNTGNPIDDPYFCATVNNPYGLPLEFEITPDLAPMLAILNKHAEAQGRLDLVKSALDDLGNRIGGVEMRMDKNPDDELDRARTELADDLNAKRCFNLLQREIEGFLFANQVAKTGRMPLKVTSQLGQLAKATQATLSAIGQATGISALALGLSNILVDEITQANARAEVRNVAAATEEINFRQFATRLAILLTLRAKQSYVQISEANITSLYNSVVAELQRINVHGSDEAALIMHLFGHATKSLPAPRKISDEHNSGSSTASSGSPKPILNLYSLTSGSTASTGFGTVAIENKTPSPAPEKKTNKKKYGGISMCCTQ